MKELNQAISAAISRMLPKISTGLVTEIDTSKSPDQYTIGGRKMSVYGPAPAVNDLVLVLSIGQQHVGLGVAVDS